jgi:UDP-3-O-[3-hydroxymyristoyl] glucosamine N-acyltransferase
MMGYHLHPAVMVSALAVKIGAQLSGPDLSIKAVAAISDQVSGALTYWQSDDPLPDTFSAGSCVIARELVNSPKQLTVLLSDNPRLAFIRLLRWLEQNKWLVIDPLGQVHPSANVHPSAVIDDGASIGAGCQIGPAVYITSQCSIGDNVKIGAGCTIGQQGFGYERDEKGVPVKFPHLGRVVIEDNSEIGSNTTIARGNLRDTRIGRHVKIDDQVYVAHNCEIGESTMIAGGARICGGVVIGTQCWVGAGSTILQGLNIGQRATIGLGAVVVSSVEIDTVVAGNPAKVLVKN